jgi:hypothetical protein
MKYIYVLIFCLLYCCFNLNAQYLLRSNSVSLALAGCDVTLANQWSSMTNPAGLGQMKNICLSMAYERRFNLNELSVKSAVFAIPSSYGTIGGYAAQYGNSAFRSSNYAMAYSRMFGKSVAAGLQINVLDQYQQSAGHSAAVYSDFGIIILPSNNVSVGIHCLNAEQASVKYADFETPVETLFEIGVAYKVMPGTVLMTETNLALNDETSVILAIETTCYKYLKLRGGYRLTTGQGGAGVGLALKHLLVDVGVAWHRPLGMISSAALCYRFN